MTTDFLKLHISDGDLVLAILNKVAAEETKKKSVIRLYFTKSRCSDSFSKNSLFWDMNNSKNSQICNMKKS